MRFVFWLIVFVSFFISSPILAHVLETDGTVGAVIHIDPDDDPVVREMANFYLEFKDKESKLDLYDCECVVMIKKDGLEISRQALVATGNLLGGGSFSFPEKGLYQLTVSGKPVDGANFQAFELSYEVRVVRENENGQVSSAGMLFWVYGTGVGVVVFLSIGLYSYYARLRRGGDKNG